MNYMKSGIGSNTANSAKTLAQQIAKQMAQEPIEILKDVKEQTTGEEVKPQQGQESQPASSEQSQQVKSQEEQIDRQKSSRMIEALNRELTDIHKQKVFSDLQSRIAQGEEIPLEDYHELTMEQKQVLQAQMEAVKKQRSMQTQEFNEVPVVHSKPSRRFGAGQKQAAQKEQTRVEKPVPPSG